MRPCVLLVLCVLSAALCAVYGATDMEEGCGERKPGEVWYEENCIKCFCDKDGAGYACLGCGTMYRPNCTAIYDYTQPYPDCCTPTWACDPAASDSDEMADVL